jgi:pilus assembly protein Flp/PilA
MIDMLRYTCGMLQARFTKSERGASLVEYAFLVGLIAIVCLASVAFVGTATSTKYSKIGSAVS